MKPAHPVLAELARGLLSASAQFEPAGAGARAKTLNGLALLASLEQVTRRSLPSMVPAAAPAQPASSAPAAGALQAQSQASRAHQPAAAPAGPPPVTTARREYQPALGDRAIVEALLHLQNRVQKTRPLARPIPSFQPLEAPKVEADPASFRYARRSPGVYHPVLRSTHPGRSS